MTSSKLLMRSLNVSRSSVNDHGSKDRLSNQGTVVNNLPYIMQVRSSPLQRSLHSADIETSRSHLLSH